MRFLLPFFIFALYACTNAAGVRTEKSGNSFYSAKNKEFRFTGRFDFSHRALPRCWNPGAYIEVGFSGTFLEIEVNDEMLYGNHNYIEVVVDNDPPKRIQLSAEKNVILISNSLQDTIHTLLICKDTESAMGYIEFAGITCEKILPAKVRSRKIEFIGDSITCGNGSDDSAVKCGDGTWYDQHNAYMSFGPLISREFNADWQLSSVSGIGMTRSCCGLETTMPQVFSKINFKPDGADWHFSSDDRSEPQVVVITLGQNDGIQDSTDYCATYVAFVKKIRTIYRKATIVCSTSPMANEKLQHQLNIYIPAITSELHRLGDLNVHPFLYEKSYRSGCFFHPTLKEHKLMAGELGVMIRQVSGWE